MCQEGPDRRGWLLREGYRLESRVSPLLLSGCVLSKFRGLLPRTAFGFSYVRFVWHLIALEHAYTVAPGRNSTNTRSVLARDSLLASHLLFASSAFHSFFLRASASLAPSSQPSEREVGFLPVASLRPIESFSFDKSLPEIPTKNHVARSCSRYSIDGQQPASACFPERVPRQTSGLIFRRFKYPNEWHDEINFGGILHQWRGTTV